MRLTHFVVREDALLYGFLTVAECSTLREVLKIGDIGPRTALCCCRGLSVSELVQAVAHQQALRLTKVPGIGKKTAERRARSRRGDQCALPADVAVAESIKLTLKALSK